MEGRAWGHGSCETKAALRRRGEAAGKDERKPSGETNEQDDAARHARKLRREKRPDADGAQRCASSRTSCMQDSLETDARSILGESLAGSIPAFDCAYKGVFPRPSEAGSLELPASYAMSDNERRKGL